MICYVCECLAGIKCFCVITKDSLTLGNSFPSGGGILTLGGNLTRWSSLTSGGSLTWWGSLTEWSSLISGGSLTSSSNIMLYSLNWYCNHTWCSEVAYHDKEVSHLKSRQSAWFSAKTFLTWSNLPQDPGSRDTNILWTMVVFDLDYSTQLKTYAKRNNKKVTV